MGESGAKKEVRWSAYGGVEVMKPGGLLEASESRVRLALYRNIKSMSQSN